MSHGPADRNTSQYQLGHTQEELRRLMIQAAVLCPITTRMLRQAGIRAGMRVLDLGCGAGDVTMLAADLVGLDGYVLGIDRSGEALSLARQRAAAHRNARFKQEAVGENQTEAGFDMVVARYVLMHQPDPLAFIRTAAAYVRPGGIIAIHDVTTEIPLFSQPQLPLWNQVGTVIRQAANALIASAQTVVATPVVLRRAGLTDVSAFCELPTGGGKGSNLFPWLADTYRLFVTGAKAKIAFDADIPAFDGLAERLEAEACAADAQVTGPAQVCAWGTV